MKILVKGNFKTISTVLIIILMGVLIGILIRYYNTPIKVSNTSYEIKTTNKPTTNIDTPSKVKSNVSGESLPDVKIEEKIENADNEEKANAEFESKNDKQKITKEATALKKEDKTSGVIISSDGSMTNKEKREILTELDNTLMELLDVVDKVQTVDETRLITDESEVQK